MAKGSYRATKRAYGNEIRYYPRSPYVTKSGVWLWEVYQLDFSDNSCHSYLDEFVCFCPVSSIEMLNWYSVFIAESMNSQFKFRILICFL